MKVDVYNQEGQKSGEVELNENIFGVESKRNLLAQYVRVYLANQRQGTAKTKTRGEVSGGGRKPWRQKGTGRARHGSIRSPIWVGGGVAHGPKGRDWHLNIPKKMRRAALFSALSLKLKEGGLLVLDQLRLDSIKTRQVTNILEKLPVKGKVLITLPSVDRNIILSARNIRGAKTTQAKSLNAYEVLNHQTILLPQESLAVIERHFLKEKEIKVERQRMDELGLSTRTLNALKKAGIETVTQLEERSDAELEGMKGLGRKRLAEIKRVVK